MTSINEYLRIRAIHVPLFKKMVLDGAERFENHMASKYYGMPTPQVKDFINFVLPYDDSKDIRYEIDAQFRSDLIEWFEREVLIFTSKEDDWLDDFINYYSLKINWKKYYSDDELTYLLILLQVRDRFENDTLDVILN